MQIVSLTGAQKVTGLAIFIGIFAIIVFVISASMTEPASAPAAGSDAPQPLPANSKPASTKSIAEATSIQAHAAVSPAANTQAAIKPSTKGDDKKIDAWNLGNAKSPTPKIPLNKVIREYEVIEINQQPETTPQVGETVSLPMLNGQKILVDVQATTINPNGDRSWSGHLQGHGEDYPIVMTYGENAIFAMITTP